MSWLNKIENVIFSITTGDGKTYSPLWKTGETSIDFNTSIFDFINVSGSLVERKQPKSNKYPLTFWFQGENNIQETDSFFVSSRDNRFWTLTHPLYGTITGQPMSMSRNDVNFNITEITVDFIETISVDYPNSNFAVKDNSFAKKKLVLETSAISYASNSNPKVEDIDKNKQSGILINSSFKNLQNDETNNIYSNAFAISQKANDNLIDNALYAIQKQQALIDLPSTYNNPILDRLNAFSRCYDRLKKTLITAADKYFFESQASTVIASYSFATVNPSENDYQLFDDVVFSTNELIRIYNDYLQVIDNASSSNYTIENNYQPNALLQSQLNDLVYFTVENLANLAFDARQERIVYTQKNTNLILLVHQYLGLDSEDTNIEQFRKINNLNLNCLFEIPKGTKIKYYI